MNNPTTPLPETQVNKDLTLLRENMYFSKVSVYDGYLVYSVPFGSGNTFADLLNFKIKKFNLNIKAECTVFKSFTRDSVTVK